MSELIVRALGYNTLADHENLFKINFTDAAKLKKKGQAAIVAGLGIMSADSKGNFKPEGRLPVLKPQLPSSVSFRQEQI